MLILRLLLALTSSIVAPSSSGGILRHTGTRVLPPIQVVPLTTPSREDICLLVVWEREITKYLES